MRPLLLFSASLGASQLTTRPSPSCSFGAASILLGLIPVFGPVTAFTSAAGAALWAADLEKRNAGGEAGGEDQNIDVGVGHVEL